MEKNFKEMKLYPEIKNAMREVMTSEENGREWMKIAREQLGDVKTLIAASKKLSKDSEIVPQQVIDFVRAEIESEKAAATEEPTDPDAYMSRELDGQEENPQTPEAQ